MSLPASFLQSGFIPAAQASLNGGRYKRLMIGSEGETDTGKTEFAMSAPGPGLVLALDRGFDACMDNPDPPPTRRPDFGFRVIQIPKATSLKNADAYLEYWRVFKDAYLAALANPDARTVVIDGDSDSWELQRLAEFGTLNQVKGPPGLAYTNVYAARRALVNKAWDSGKIIIASNKLRAEYRPVLDEHGKAVIRDGRELRERTGNLERQGFPDQDYLWQVQIRHLYKEARVNPITGKLVPAQWGLRILKAKANTQLTGQELWGDDCNFPGLVQLIYPHVDPGLWGF